MAVANTLAYYDLATITTYIPLHDLIINLSSKHEYHQGRSVLNIVVRGEQIRHPNGQLEKIAKEETVRMLRVINNMYRGQQLVPEPSEVEQFRDREVAMLRWACFQSDNRYRKNMGTVGNTKLIQIVPDRATSSVWNYSS
jgi:hypothetical protein